MTQTHVKPIIQYFSFIRGPGFESRNRQFFIKQIYRQVCRNFKNKEKEIDNDPRSQKNQTQARIKINFTCIIHRPMRWSCKTLNWKLFFPDPTSKKSPKIITGGVRNWIFSLSASHEMSSIFTSRHDAITSQKRYKIRRKMFLPSPTNLNRLMVPFFGGMEIVVSRENKSRRGILSNLNSSNFGYVKLSRFLLTKKSFENMPKMNLSNYLILYLFVV